MSGYEFAATAAAGIYLAYVAFVVGGGMVRRQMDAKIDRLIRERDDARDLYSKAERELCLINIERDAARRLLADWNRHTGGRNGREIRTLTEVANTGMARRH